MLVQVRIEYSAAPPSEEIEVMGRVGRSLSIAPDDVRAYLDETGPYPTIVVEFTTHTQAQYKVVNYIGQRFTEVANDHLYRDVTIRFDTRRGRRGYR